MSNAPEEKQVSDTQVSDTTEEKEVSAEDKKVSEEVSKPVKVKKSAEEKQANIELSQQQMRAAADRKQAEAALTKKTKRRLIEQFPNAITENTADIKPLMIGVLQEIIAKSEKHLNKKGLSLALTAYCSAPEYLQATIDQTHRIDLDGNPVQEIVEFHKQVATKKLEDREKKRVQQEELKRRQQANIEAAEAKKAAAEKKATEAAEKVAKVPAEKIAKAAKVPAAEKEAKPKKVESKPVTVVVKTKKAEPAPTTVIIKTKKIEVPPVSALSTTVAGTESESESETGEPVRKKLSLKSKAEKS